MFTSKLKKINSLFFVILLFALIAVPIKAQELSAEEIIAKHLDSIGSQQVRSTVKTRMALGTSEFIIKVPYGLVSGKALLASEADNILFLSSFASVDYPLERVGFFKSKINVPFIKPGVRSPLGTYLMFNSKILSEGLFAGSILSTWALLDLKNSKANITNGGRKKIDGRETYILNYIPKGGFGSDSSFKLFFDAENFRHLRTEYHQKIPTKSYPIGVMGQADLVSASNLLVEEFGSFKAVDGLTLPHSYTASLRIDAVTGTNEYQWNIKISQYAFNQKFEPELFNFDKPVAGGAKKNSY